MAEVPFLHECQIALVLLNRSRPIVELLLQTPWWLGRPTAMLFASPVWTSMVYCAKRNHHQVLRKLFASELKLLGNEIRRNPSFCADQISRAVAFSYLLDFV